IGSPGNSGGSFTINGGTAIIGGDANVGSFTPGTLSIAGGSVAIAGALKLGLLSGTVNFSNGLLQVGTLNTQHAPSRFNWTGGSLQLNSDLLIDSTGPFGAAATLDANRNLIAYNNEYIANSGSGS